MTKKENTLISSIKNIYWQKPGERFLLKGRYWFLVIFLDPVGIPLAKLLAKARGKIHPNHITILSVLFSLIAAYMFFRGQLIYGAFFFWLNLLMDTVDGKLARLTKTSSKFGKRLDYYSDKVNILVMYFGLWWSQYYLQGQWLLGGILIGIHYLIMFLAIFIKNRTYKTAYPRISSYYSDFEESGLTFFFGPLFGVVYILFPIAVALQGISHIILFIRQKEKPDIKKNLTKMFTR